MSLHSSTSTVMNVARSPYMALRARNFGAMRLHGPHLTRGNNGRRQCAGHDTTPPATTHQAALKSTITGPSVVHRRMYSALDFTDTTLGSPDPGKTPGKMPLTESTTDSAPALEVMRMMVFFAST